MIGAYLLSLAFASSLIAMVAYGILIRRENPRLIRIARAGFHVTVISFMVAAAVLMYLILTHDYRFTYVVEHSSNNLSRPLLVASFYAGQEGSFMLWTLLTALIGVFVLGYSQKVRYEPYVMAPFMMVLACLLLILVVKSPFETIWASHPEQNIPADFIPTNGRGLNPTLENLWITIHPPILFTGFASMTVPFIFAMAGLLKRDYQKWISISLPWVLFSCMSLGFGIMLGGWWAYETLGWGGFWAWDPVENSSLIPWLACVALVHTMLVQKRTGSAATAKGAAKVGGLVKTNFVLAIVAFGLILYSTFLTRSGILGDTSVHSFVAPGWFVYTVLLAIMILFIGGGLGLFFWRMRDLRNSEYNFPLMSRENALGLGSAVILASAMVVLLGTSWPLFMPLFGLPKIALEQDFYNTLHIPIALMIVLLNGISMRMKWKDTPREQFVRDIRIGLIIAIAGTVGLVLLGIHDPIYVALGFGSLLAIAVNVQIGAKIIRGNPKFVGAYVSHTGVALMMLGIIFTARYSVTEHVRLVQGQSKTVFDYTVTYTGSEQIELEKTDRTKYEHHVRLEKDGSSYEAKPVTFLSDFNKRESAFMEPGILYYPTKDIYIAPKMIDQEGGDPIATLHKGESAKVPFDSSVTVRFEKFDMSLAQSEGKQGAVFEVATRDSSYYLTSYRKLSDGAYVAVDVPGSDITVGFADLITDRENLSNSQAILVFKSPSNPPPPSRAAITLDVSIKPFISFVWAGVVIMVGGFLFSIVRRRKEVDPIIEASDEEGTPVAGGDTLRNGGKRRSPTVEVENPIAARSSLRR